MQRPEWIIGIDEVGRGPLAGPVAVGVVAVPQTFAWSQLLGVGDSKQVSAAKRQELALAAKQLRRHGELRFAVVTVTAPVIDRVGIVPAIDRAIARGLQKVLRSTIEQSEIVPAACAVKLDGGLRAPDMFLQQETIVRGDSVEPTIGLASILAKVHRDDVMIRLGEKPEFRSYGFPQHKGYGTATHCRAIEQYGLSRQHRRSFCRRLAP